MEAVAIFGKGDKEKQQLISEELNFIGELTQNIYVEKEKDSDSYQTIQAHPQEVFQHKRIGFKTFRNGFLGGLKQSDFEKYWKVPTHPKLTAKYLNNYLNYPTISKLLTDF